MNHVQLARKAATLDHAGGTYWRYKLIRAAYDVRMMFTAKFSGMWDFTNAYWQRMRELNGEVSV